MNTTEITEIPQNRHSSQKLPTQRFGDLMKRRSLKCCQDQVLGVSCLGMDLPMSHTVSSDGLGWTFQIIESSYKTQHCWVTLATGQGLFLQSQLTLLVQQKKESYERQQHTGIFFLWSATRVHNFLIH